MTDRYDELGRALGGRLKTPVAVSGDFDARVMNAVREQAATRAAHASWWRRPRVMMISPITGLAAAAALLFAVGFGTWSVSRATGHGPLATAVQTTDHRPQTTGELVRFVLVEPNASRVSLVGDFNAWDENAVTLEPTGVDGVWTATVRVPPGRHEYAFIVRANGDERWVADPFSTRSTDEFGTETSVISVHAARAPSGA